MLCVAQYVDIFFNQIFNLNLIFMTIYLVKLVELLYNLSLYPGLRITEALHFICLFLFFVFVCACSVHTRCLWWWIL